MTTDIVPFTLATPQESLDDLRDRLARTRWPDQIPGLGWSRGVEMSYLRELADYWLNEFDWRAQEADLNAFPQYTTTIDGTQIHFLHVRSANPDATPLLLVHGWPGSVIEFLDLIEPLTTPADHDARAFHVVVPSMPGFGLSGPTPDAGWDSGRIATAFAELMRRLGYDRYIAQGGDFGAFVAPDLGRVDPEHVIGVHVNAATFGFIPFGQVDDDVAATLTDVERDRLGRLATYLSDGNGYFQIQATRPHTIGVALNDSPVGQLAWIVDKFKEWTYPSTELPEKALSRDRMLADVTLYWLTGTATSSAQIYYESMHSGRWPTPSTVPTGVAVFAEDVAIRRFAEPLNAIVHWSDIPEGGHFAAMERPGLLAADLRAFATVLAA
ncbi:MAG TPA: epoxide hydrolase [Cellulomonas sp.]|uniref:epoxide hydrolase family protein n=1 Tax=Cellulomonas sp. TaxID=40001 RepID=UPI002E30988A|nr:epoxide hydrolase family protein [Cellulomonas sp.]HEX5333380.1 epoxide hydrolase [Cellulomonas sp.]